MVLKQNILKKNLKKKLYIKNRVIYYIYILVKKYKVFLKNNGIVKKLN